VSPVRPVCVWKATLFTARWRSYDVYDCRLIVALFTHGENQMWKLEEIKEALAFSFRHLSFLSLYRCPPLSIFPQLSRHADSALKLETQTGYDAGGNYWNVLENTHLQKVKECTSRIHTHTHTHTFHNAAHQRDKQCCDRIALFILLSTKWDYNGTWWSMLENEAFSLTELVLLLYNEV